MALLHQSCFDRPIIIISAPRSGSTLLFELLSHSESLWTIGGESHAVIEKHRQLNITAKGFASNALDISDWDADIDQQLKADFEAALRDHQGAPYQDKLGPIRFLEKTPKNSLRIDFLNKLFPDAHFIYLVRDPKENIASIMQAWRSGRFRTYPGLPGWGGDWSLLLPPGWQALRGKPLEQVACFQWCQANDHIMASLDKLPQDRWHLVSYHDLVADPKGTTQKIVDFCQLPLDDSLAERCDGKLPHSRYTVSAPKADKWLANYAAINAIWPQTQASLDKINQRLIARGLSPFATELPSPPLSAADTEPDTTPSLESTAKQGTPGERAAHGASTHFSNSGFSNPGASSTSYPNTARNAPCPCGSGLRYKACHGKLQ